MDEQRAETHDEKCSTSSSSTMAVNEVVLENSSKETDESISNSIDENKKAKGVIILDGNDLLVGKEELKVSSSSSSSSCAIDVKLDDGNDREMVCRICHLGCDQSPERGGGVINGDGKMMKESSLIKLGCGCKDDLGVAHSHCAEAWFKLKGNRICEICGEGARNVRGILQEQMDVEWNDRGSYANYSPETQAGWWRGQPCCNFLMACLIVAFVLPWFFRVKIV